MGNFVQWWYQIVGWGEMMFSRYQAWLLPGVLVASAVIGLILLYSEWRRAALDRKKWEGQPRPQRSHAHEVRLRAGQVESQYSRIPGSWVLSRTRPSD